MKDSKKIDLTIIILNFNTQKLLADCLYSIDKSQLEGFNVETIVVDNASSDDSAKMIRAKFPEVLLIVNSENLGFAAGNNKAVPFARGDFLLFLNPDTLVPPQTIAKMIEFMLSHPSGGVATCRVELPDGRLDEACHRGFPTPWNSFCHFSGLEKLFPETKFFSGYSLGYLSKETTHPIDSAVGAFMMVRREAGQEIGWWDEDYFWYGEDLDFCFRIKQKGWQIFFVPSVKITHYKGASSGIKGTREEISTADDQTKKRSLKASTEAMRIFYRKHYLTKYPKILNWFVLKGIDLLENKRLK